MKIHALTAGHVTLKRAFLHASTGIRRRLDLLLPGPWAPPVPILVWLIEHDGQRILVDAGDQANPRDPPFARSSVTPADELPSVLRAAGTDPGAVTFAVLTHMHPDHYNGVAHLSAPVYLAQQAWQDITSFGGRMLQRMSGAPLPEADFRPLALQDGPFGRFAAHHPLTADGRVVLVATPGHTPGHCSVIAIDDDGRHVLIAGDAIDSLEQLHARRPDAIAPDPKVQRQTIDRILDHGREHPTICLPSHDPQSAERLAAGAQLPR